MYYLTHAKRALGVVSECHVLANRHHSTSARQLLNINARRVYLIIEREAPLQSDTACRQRYNEPTGAQQDALPIVLVEKHYTVRVWQSAVEQEPGHFEVAH